MKNEVAAIFMHSIQVLVLKESGYGVGEVVVEKISTVFVYTDTENDNTLMSTAGK